MRTCVVACPQASALEAVGTGRSSMAVAAAVAAANGSPCASETASLLGVTPVLSGNECTLTLPSGASLSMSNEVSALHQCAVACLILASLLGLRCFRVPGCCPCRVGGRLALEAGW